MEQLQQPKKLRKLLHFTVMQPLKLEDDMCCNIDYTESHNINTILIYCPALNDFIS